MEHTDLLPFIHLPKVLALRDFTVAELMLAFLLSSVVKMKWSILKPPVTVVRTSPEQLKVEMTLLSMIMLLHFS